jgi:hypothetical protein
MSAPRPTPVAYRGGILYSTALQANSLLILGSPSLVDFICIRKTVRLYESASVAATTQQVKKLLDLRKTFVAADTRHFEETHMEDLSTV